MREKTSSVAYAVQSNINKSEIYIFTKRTVLCKEMSKLTEAAWVKSTLDYHFANKKEVEFEYRGYTIYLRKENETNKE
jgi:hypothetical protein